MTIKVFSALFVGGKGEFVTVSAPPLTLRVMSGQWGASTSGNWTWRFSRLRIIMPSLDDCSASRVAEASQGAAEARRVLIALGGGSRDATFMRHQMDLGRVIAIIITWS